MSPSDTIVAISSTVGHAARIILRLSGPQSLPITRSLSPDAPPTPGATRTTLHLPDHLSFRSWLYTFPAPHSYTGEDLVELHLPGNEVLARLTLDHCIALGARPAEAGEFTARAYFNGRLDLTAAEGVAATIHASNESELRAARQLMAGALAKRLRPLMDRVAETLALVEVAIDFTDEEVTFLPAAEVAARAASVSADLAALATDSDQLERLSTEPTIVLVGRPNAGKSTLLNALAGTHRAVVSPIAGTTRDVLSADVALKRGIVKLLDVAGLEEPHSPPGPQRDIEESMRRRALDAVASADVVALVLDSADTRPSVPLPRPADLTILTKSDATKRDGAISALTGDGLDSLRARLDDLAFGPTAPPNSDRLALNRRHLAAIDAARSALDRATSSAQSNAGPEVVALDFRDALDSLGSILGVISPDDLLGLVFSRFCIGK